MQSRIFYLSMACLLLVCLFFFDKSVFHVSEANCINPTCIASTFVSCWIKYSLFWKLWFWNFNVLPNHLDGGPVKMKTAGAHPQSFWFTRFEKGMRICISNRIQGDAVASDPGFTLWETHSWIIRIALHTL